jgi:hypothetical protein
MKLIASFGKKFSLEKSASAAGAINPFTIAVDHQ